jgi:hypothetical protein
MRVWISHNGEIDKTGYDRASRFDVQKIGLNHPAGQGIVVPNAATLLPISRLRHKAEDD